MTGVALALVLLADLLLGFVLGLLVGRYRYGGGRHRSSINMRP